ncbi:MAG: hypothetical protein P4M11_04655 [Candidatus Pacebacteria bacterium]|nr:hypothetical protein [Candidatus Paceibacterota bacterium]
MKAWSMAMMAPKKSSPMPTHMVRQRTSQTSIAAYPTQRITSAMLNTSLPD